MNVLFRTAAHAMGPRVIAVVLSGTLDDGTAGSIAVKQRGGRVFVQHPSDALFPGMPKSVIEHSEPDLVAPVEKLAAALVELVSREAQEVDPPGPPSSVLLSMEADLATLDEAAMNHRARSGRPTGYQCPDCGGSLFQIEDGGLLRFRCRVGHAWSASGLLGEQSNQLDNAFWLAMRSLEEKAALARELAGRADQRGNALTRDRYLSQANEALNAASLVRSVIQAGLRLTVSAEDENVG